MTLAQIASNRTNLSQYFSASLIIMISMALAASIIGYQLAWSQESVIKAEQASLQHKIETLQPRTKHLKEANRNTLSEIAPSAAKAIIEQRAKEVILAIKNKDMSKLSTFIHPEKGVRFSAYSYVDQNSDIVFHKSQIPKLLTENKKYVWGVYPGSGMSIELTPKGYFNSFVYRQDFANAKEIGYNQILGHGNSRNNSFEVYPNSIIVEYYFPGFDPKYKGMDWESLRLVFEKKDSIWYMVGIIHDQWTI